MKKIIYAIMLVAMITSAFALSGIIDAVLNLNTPRHFTLKPFATNRIRFSGMSYTLRISEVKKDRVLMQVGEKNYTIMLETPKTIDVNDDSIYDLTITLDEVRGMTSLVTLNHVRIPGRINMTSINSINVTTESQEEINETIRLEEQINETPPEIPKRQISRVLTMVLAVLVLIIIALVVYINTEGQGGK